jgi:two-component system nitrate/nitrite response regulator NarL
MRIVLSVRHHLLADALAYLIRRRGHDVAEVVTAPRAVRSAITEHRPDVCVVDIDPPDVNELTSLVELGATVNCQILLLTLRSGPDVVRAVARAGAAGYLTYDQHVEDILGTLDRLSSGKGLLIERASPAIGRRRAVPASDDVLALRFLTGREREALFHIAEGKSTQQIAISMHVAYSTARTHVQNVLTKLGVRSRLQAAALANRTGLLDELRVEHTGLPVSI